MLITAANAHELAAKSAEARRKLPMEPANIPPIIREGRKITDYHELRLMRVRSQLNTLDTRVDSELQNKAMDTKKLKEMVDAQLRISEQERFLAGRPAPGSLKPKQERERKPIAAEPIE